MDEVAQSVEMICGTTKGDRTVVPSFGIPMQPFDGPNQSDFVTAIAQWENRAVPTITIVGNDNGTSNVQVAIKLAQGTTT